VEKHLNGKIAEVYETGNYIKTVHGGKFNEEMIFIEGKY